MQTIRRFALIPAGSRLVSPADVSLADNDANAGKPTETPAARKTFRREKEPIALSKGDKQQNQSTSLPAMTPRYDETCGSSQCQPPPPPPRQPGSQPIPVSWPHANKCCSFSPSGFACIAMATRTKGARLVPPTKLSPRFVTAPQLLRVAR